LCQATGKVTGHGGRPNATPPATCATGARVVEDGRAALDDELATAGADDVPAATGPAPIAVG
jgi:hypothetical protein